MGKLVLIVAVVAALFFGSSGEDVAGARKKPPRPTPTVSPSPSPTAVPTASPSPTLPPKPSPSPTVAPTPEPTPSPLVTYTVAVVLINHTNNVIEPFTPQHVNDAVFLMEDTQSKKSAAGFFDESSFGKVRIVGQVYGWWTVPYDNTTCSTAAWKASALAHFGLPAEGQPGAYNHYAIVWPYTAACQYGARAGSFYNVPGTKFKYQDFAHEFGHGLNLNHANGWICTDNGVQVAFSATCENYEYGDYYDNMGNTNGHWFSTWTRTRVGWLDETQVVTQTGQYILDSAHLSNPENPQLIMIPRPDGTYFALEYRRPYGIYEQWNWPFSQSSVDGILVRTATELPELRTQNAKTHIIDMTPGTDDSGMGGDGWWGTALAPGQTFSYDGITLTTDSISPTNAVLTVTMP